MTRRVVVLGAGYAGASTVLELERRLEPGELTWVSEHDHHLVLHESHRVISDPDAAEEIAIPVEDITADATEFVEGTVAGIAPEESEVELADGETVPYDRLVVALGSETAYYGIPGLDEHAHTLKSLEDAEEIRGAVEDAADGASPEEPAEIVVGGAGLSGVQVAGEVAEYRDEHDAAIDVTVVEALDEILPHHDEGLQQRIRGMLEARDVEITTGDPITEVDGAVQFESGDTLDHDVLVWAGGVTGPEAVESSGLDADHNRIEASDDFTTSHDDVFAVGDVALVDQGDGPAPPTAQAAWQAGEVAARNVVRSLEDEALDEWRYEDLGTLISVGEDAVAHDVKGLPVQTFDRLPARFLKKFVAARWIAKVTSWRRGLGAWGHL